MKLKILVVLLVLSVLVHCNESSPEPRFWEHFYVFVDENGNNFFDSNPEYFADSVMHDADWQSPQPFLSDKFENNLFTSEKYEEYDVFETGAWSRELFIFFGNGDIDTLTPKWSPERLHGKFDFFMKEYKSFKYFYNSELILHWDFEKNPELQRWDLIGLYGNGTPYIIEIPKAADPDEFDGNQGG